MRTALIQMPVTADKAENLTVARDYVRRAADGGAQLAVLPEMFCCLYTNDAFRANAEPAGGPVHTAMAGLARETGLCWWPGPCRGGRRENIQYILCLRPGGPSGGVPSEDAPFRYRCQGRPAVYGVGDLHRRRQCPRFLTRRLASWACASALICASRSWPGAWRWRGARAIVTPAAFNMTTGPAHWELLFRQRAVDNQLFTLGVAPSRDEQGPYVSYGNTILCSPWGEVLARAAAPRPCCWPTWT